MEHTERGLEGFPMTKRLAEPYTDCIYMLKPLEECSPVRIGLTSNPETRVIDHQLSNWLKVHICFVIWTPSARQLERLIQWELHPAQMNRDWFAVHIDVALETTKRLMNLYGFKVIDGKRHMDSGRCDFSYGIYKPIPDYHSIQVSHQLGTIYNELQEASPT
ncbi:hypothetical protein CMI47_12480 [Candidatus Pacearchaeota archaeon]|jgi:hypothetical protein|nr:hypothetical protein [Candidatus Pacearchaeota archaeon]